MKMKQNSVEAQRGGRKVEMLAVALTEYKREQCNRFVLHMLLFDSVFEQLLYIARSRSLNRTIAQWNSS